MHSRKNFAIVLLALSTAVVGILAWQQYQRAERNAVTVSTAHDDLEQKLAAAERHAADLEARLAALQSMQGPETPPASGVEAPDNNNNNDRRREEREQANARRRAEMEAIMSDPEVIQLMTAQQRAGLDARYATLFKQLNLPPAQLEAFKNLLLEKQNAPRDVMMAARETGMNPRENRDDLRKLVQEANAETDAAIAAAIGTDKFSQYQNFESTGPQRALVDQLNRTMSYSATALTDAQSQALVQILAQNSAAGKGDPRDRLISSYGGPWGAGASQTITDNVIAQARTILSPEQVQILEQQQAAQQNAQKLRELLRPRDQPRRR